MKTFDDRKKSVEAYITKIKRKRRRTAVMITCLLLVLSLVLFVPYNSMEPSVSRYADSEYYGVIQNINTMRFQKPKYKNNFHAMIGFLAHWGAKSATGADGMLENNNLGIQMAPGAAPDGFKGEEYVEVTDNQVDGVTEADIFKRSDKYVYYLSGDTLSVYTIAQADSQLAGCFQLISDVGTKNFNNMEMYLSTDCRTVTILANTYYRNNESGDRYTFKAMTVVINLDVSDPANIMETARMYFEGDMLSSRVVDGDLLLSYNYGFIAGNADFDDPSTFVPQYGTPGDMICIPGENIVCPENVTDARYTVVCKLDGDTLEVLDATALLGYSEDLYVSSDTIFATRSYSDRNDHFLDNGYTRTAMTEITGISYGGDSLEVLGSICLEGTVKDQYSMDQYEGILRVVTSTSVSNVRETAYGESISMMPSPAERNVNLYCIDLAQWKVAAEVIAFAPAGEDAQSVRFDGVHAYVCTAEVITLTDPVYFFDLSDLQNITWTDTGVIDGYSTSLIQLGDGYLLGVGFGSGRKMKIEVYQEVDGKVISVCAYERDADFSVNYKSYLVDRENSLFGLAAHNWHTELEFILLHFDGVSLLELERFEVPGGEMSSNRAFIADGWLYVLNMGEIYTRKIW